LRGARPDLLVRPQLRGGDLRHGHAVDGLHLEHEVVGFRRHRRPPRGPADIIRPARHGRKPNQAATFRPPAGRASSKAGLSSRRYSFGIASCVPGSTRVTARTVISDVPSSTTPWIWVSASTSGCRSFSRRPASAIVRKVASRSLPEGTRTSTTALM